MAAGDAVQIGAQWLIGFGSHSYTGYMPENIEQGTVSSDTEIPDERGATQTILVQNPGKTLSGTWLIKSTGSLTPPSKNAEVSLTPPTGTVTIYRCLDAKVRTTRGVAQLTMSLIREDSMAASYDAS